jgi:hypothetical protein
VFQEDGAVADGRPVVLTRSNRDCSRPPVRPQDVGHPRGLALVRRCFAILVESGKSQRPSRLRAPPSSNHLTAGKVYFVNNTESQAHERQKAASRELSTRFSQKVKSACVRRRGWPRRPNALEAAGGVIRAHGRLDEINPRGVSAADRPDRPRGVCVSFFGRTWQWPSRSLSIYLCAI